MSEYQIHNNASDLSDPRNAPNYTGTYCHSCGCIFDSPGGESSVENCWDHFWLSDPEIQREILGELMVENIRLKQRNLALFKEKERLISQMRNEATMKEAVGKWTDSLIYGDKE